MSTVKDCCGREKEIPWPAYKVGDHEVVYSGTWFVDGEEVDQDEEYNECLGDICVFYKWNTRYDSKPKFVLSISMEVCRDIELYQCWWEYKQRGEDWRFWREVKNCLIHEQGDAEENHIWSTVKFWDWIKDHMDCTEWQPYVPIENVKMKGRFKMKDMGCGTVRVLDKYNLVDSPVENGWDAELRMLALKNLKKMKFAY